MSSVTKNGIHLMHTQGKKEGQFYTLQVISIKSIHSSRFRVVISDSEFFDQAFIGGTAHHFFSNSMVQLYQLIKIKDFNKVDCNGAYIISINEIEPGPTTKAIIGSPAKYESKSIKNEPVPNSNKNTFQNKENSEFTSVKALTSNIKDFVIKARVTKKYELKSWKNDRGEGKLFSINIIDSYNEEISVTFFKEEAEKFYHVIDEGKVYVFRNGQVKLSNKKFQTVNCEYSICVDRRTEIQPVADESAISTIKLSPITIDSIPNLPLSSSVDICAGIIDAGEVIEISLKKTPGVVKKRTVKLLDQSNAVIELTLWGADTTHPVFNYPTLPIVCIGKNLKISNFNGVSLTLDRNASQIIYNPDLPQVKPLKNWLARNQNVANARVLSIRASIGVSDRIYKTFAEIKEDAKNCDKEDSYLVGGFIGFIRKDEPGSMFYTACKNVGKCKKKVIKESNGLYKCESCDECFENCEFKYILSIKIQDSTDCLWATAFDDVGNFVIGNTASELHAMYIDNIELFEETVAKAHYKRIEGVIKLKINDTPHGKRPKYVLNSVKSPDYQKSLGKNLAMIKEMCT